MGMNPDHWISKNKTSYRFKFNGKRFFAKKKMNLLSPITGNITNKGAIKYIKINLKELLECFLDFREEIINLKEFILWKIFLINI